MSLRLPPEWQRYRVRSGPLGSDDSVGHNGMFVVPACREHRGLDVMVSDGVDPVCENWEHVSVKARVQKYTYTPSWDEMCWVRDQLWEAEDCVVQFHPPHSRYINRHPNVLHLWRHRTLPELLPPLNLV